jgi:hypothetical protein
MKKLIFFCLLLPYLSKAAIGITDVKNTFPSTCNGSALAYANGNSLPFTFKWSNGTTAAKANNLCAGVYYVTVTNRLGCEFVHSVTIGTCDGESSYNSLQILTSSVKHVREDFVNPNGPFIVGANYGSGIYLSTGFVNPIPPNPNPWPVPAPEKYFKWLNEAGQIVGTEESLINVPPGKYCVYMKAGCGSYNGPTCFEIGSCNKQVLINPKIVVNSLPMCIGPSWGAGGNLEVSPKELNGYPIVSYAWSGPDGFSSTAQSITPTSGQGNYNVVVTNTCGKTSSVWSSVACCNDSRASISFQNPCFKLNILNSLGHDAYVRVTPPVPRPTNIQAGVGDPHYHGIPECAKKAKVDFNGRTYLLEYKDANWELKSPIIPGHANTNNGTLLIKVNRNSLNGVHSVSVQNECGCAATAQSINFGNEGSPNGHVATSLDRLDYWSTGTQSNLYTEQYGSFFTNLELGWTREELVIYGCGASSGVCGATNGYVGIGSFEEASLFSYVREEGKGPCEGGTLYCDQQGQIPIPINGTPIVNWDAQIAPCTYATGCIFPAGNIPGITDDASVFVIDPGGFRVPGTNCGNEPPSGSQCPDGVAIPMPGLESCMVRYICRTTGEIIEEIDYSEYCICRKWTTSVVRRCKPPGVFYPSDGDPEACGFIPTNIPVPSSPMYKDCEQAKPGPDTIGERSNKTNFENIELLPNPTLGAIQGLFTSPDLFQKEINASIVNIQGEVVSSMFFRLKSNDTFQIEAFESLPAGIYFVRFELEKPITLKVVKSTE